MAYFITKEQINELAYIVPVDVSLFKDNYLNVVQTVDVANILGRDFYEQILSDIPSYTELIQIYINPFFAHSVKVIVLSAQQSELVADGEFSYKNLPHSHIKATNDLIGKLKQNLISYIKLTYDVNQSFTSGIRTKIYTPIPSPSPIPPVVPFHTHLCNTIFVNDLDHPPNLMDLCDWQQFVHDSLKQHFYSFVNTLNFSLSSVTFVTVLELVKINLDPGNYEVKISYRWSLNSTNRSLYFQISIDGGTEWIEWNTEPKDVTDQSIASFFKPFYFSSQVDFHIIFQARLEDSSDTGIINSCSLILDSKL